jgi:hypothetical protein
MIFYAMGVPNKIRAEIILTKPDPDNAGVGKAKRDPSHSIG